VIARRDELRSEPEDFLVVECKDWHQAPVQRDAVEAVALRAALMRAMPVLAVSRRVSASAWRLAQLLDVRIITEQDLHKGQLPPLSNRPHPTSLALTSSLVEGGALMWSSPLVDATGRFVRPAYRTPFGVGEPTIWGRATAARTARDLCQHSTSCHTVGCNLTVAQ